MEEIQDEIRVREQMRAMAIAEGFNPPPVAEKQFLENQQTEYNNIYNKNL